MKDAEKEAEEFVSEQECLVTLPYTLKSVRDALVQYQTTAYLKGHSSGYDKGKAEGKREALRAVLNKMDEWDRYDMWPDLKDWTEEELKA